MDLQIGGGMIGVPRMLKRMLERMLKNALVALALVLGVAVGTSLPAWSQKTAKAVPKIDLDAGADSDDPDPLTPQGDSKGPLMAPGAPAAAPAAPVGEPDPVVALLRERLQAPPSSSRGSAGERDDLAGLAAYYATAAQPVWVGKGGGLTERGKQAAAEIARADEWGLKASAFELPAAPAEGADASALADAEIKMSVAVLKYARHSRGGRLEPGAVSRLLDQKARIYDPASVMAAIAIAPAADVYLRELNPRHHQFQLLRQALAAARTAAAAGGEGKEARVAASNVHRLIVNMERWRWLPDDLGKLYVWDSVPEQMTRVYQEGMMVASERIVVGKLSTPTPIFSADMQFIIFHPSWGVPPGMKVNELLPQLRKTGGGWLFSTEPTASDVLRSHGLQVSYGGRPIDPDKVNWSSADIRQYEFSQPPGPRNVLGVVKFRFPNKHNVYMHDTPERNLFGGAVRTFSHGCMRVQNAVKFAEVLLERGMGWAPGKVAEYARRGGEIKLTTPIPVHITYFTAIADESGKVDYRNDLYGIDGRMVAALEGSSARLVTSAAESNAPAAKSARAPASRRAAAKKRKPQPSDGGFNPFAALFGD